MQIDNIRGMLLESSELWAHLCAPGCLCLCSSALKSWRKGISASPRVVLHVVLGRNSPTWVLWD